MNIVNQLHNMMASHHNVSGLQVDPLVVSPDHVHSVIVLETDGQRYQSRCVLLSDTHFTHRDGSHVLARFKGGGGELGLG